ncbi:MAG: heme/hemin ABC transporter substrate-binding protein [Pararhodobacter sp.]
MRRLALCLLAVLVATPTIAQDRIVVIGGALTEIVFALDQGHRVVGRDTTSTYPPEAAAQPDVGYMRALSAEGLVSLDPDLIIADAGAGPRETVEVLRAAGVPFVQVPTAQDAAGVLARIDAVADALGVDGQPLHQRVAAGFAALQRPDGADGRPVRAMFILSATGGRITASGSDTAAAGILQLAGAENAVQGFSGYRQLNDEAVALAAPDVIVMMDRSGDHALSDAQIQSHPALGLTPAAQVGRIVRMDGLYLLGFGPRTPQAARALMDALGG